MTAPKFEGTLSAWAQRPVPNAGSLRIRDAISGNSETATGLCRADLCSQIRHEMKNGLNVFTYVGDGSAAPERVQLYSEQSTVVIDNIAGKN